jgi:hypothetical protein
LRVPAREDGILFCAVDRAVATMTSKNVGMDVRRTEVVSDVCARGLLGPNNIEPFAFVKIAGSASHGTQEGEGHIYLVCSSVDAVARHK